MITNLLQYDGNSGALAFILIKDRRERRIQLNSVHWREGIWVSNTWVSNNVGEEGFVPFRLQFIY